jgi:hypothetical protein
MLNPTRRLVAILGIAALALTVAATPSSAISSHSANLISTSRTLSANKILIATKIPLAATSGQTIKLIAPKVSPSAKLTYQWFLAGKAIKGATRTTLKLSAAQMGKTLYAQTTAKFKTGKALAIKSNVITVGNISAAKPTLTFSDETQLEVTSSIAVSLPATEDVSFSWSIDGVKHELANKETFMITPETAGKKLQLTATYAAAGYLDTDIKSLAFDVPVAGAPVLKTLWEQNFNGDAGSSVDAAAWTHAIGDGHDDPAGDGWGNAEKQYYNADQVKLDGSSNLVISAAKVAGEPNAPTCYYGKCEWVSGRIDTYNKFGFKYGRMEARIKVTDGQGVWPAFWMLGANRLTTRWPLCGEIDIAEWRGQDLSKVQQTLHMPKFFAGGGPTKAVDLVGSTAASFHTYAVDWTKNRVTWSVDGVTQRTFTTDETGTLKWPFNAEQYLLLNVAMGGGFVGGIDSSVKTATMTVDWIKYSSVNGIGELITH